MATNDSVPEHLTQPRQPSTASSPEVAEKKEENLFECHVCLEAPREPVVTPCGHLYCWPCLFRWLRMQGQNAQCPVCKAAISRRSVIPIYGRGGSSSRARNEEGVPPRPSGHREQPERGMPGVPHFGVHHPTFGRFNPYGAGYENFGLSASGFFPNLFGLQIAYPHMNEPPREEPQQNEQEDGLPDIGAYYNQQDHFAVLNQQDKRLTLLFTILFFLMAVAKIFLLLTVFIAVIITTF